MPRNREFLLVLVLHVKRSLTHCCRGRWRQHSPCRRAEDGAVAARSGSKSTHVTMVVAAQDKTNAETVGDAILVRHDKVRSLCDESGAMFWVEAMCSLGPWATCLSTTWATASHATLSDKSDWMVRNARLL